MDTQIPEFSEDVKIRKIREILIDWESENYEDFPWRNTGNKFHALVAELMLQRTRAGQVLDVYKKFVVTYPDLESAFLANKNEIRDILSPLGLNWRIEKIISLIEKLVLLGVIPENYDELIKLPGVGDYIASAYLSFHIGKCRPIIDSNAVRLCGRIFNLEIRPETRRNKRFRELVHRITPSKECRIFNYGVLDFSRKICKYKPFHRKCPLKKMCGYYNNIQLE
ncbi:hypothetical protein KA005_04165 [bacterium]|nr:hypothetical protein [bacterium]